MSWDHQRRRSCLLNLTHLGLHAERKIGTSFAKLKIKVCLFLQFSSCICHDLPVAIYLSFSLRTSITAVNKIPFTITEIFATKKNYV